VKKVPLFLITLLLLFSAIAAPCRAVEQITALSSAAEVSFPAAITFRLEAQSAVDITDVRLCYHVNKTSSVWVFNEIKPEFEKEPKVEVVWTWQMKKCGGLPPGAEVQYWWIIRDAGGNELETPPRVMEFKDLRYSWKSLSEGKVSLFWYRGGETFAGELMDAARGTLVRLAADTGVSLQRPVKIYIYASSQDLLGALIYPEEWTGGVAFPEYGIVAIGISEGELACGKRTIAHELTHIVTYQLTFNPYSGIPTWLNEGLSVYAEGEMNPLLKALLLRAISENELFSVRTLCSRFPAHAQEARLCYAQSYSLVKFLIDIYGGDKMKQLLAVFKEGSSCDSALERVYDFDSDGLDARWRAAVGASSPLVTSTLSSLPQLTPLGRGLPIRRLLIPLVPGWHWAC
jgi:hypothetical protein